MTVEKTDDTGKDEGPSSTIPNAGKLSSTLPHTSRFLSSKKIFDSRYFEESIQSPSLELRSCCN